MEEELREIYKKYNVPEELIEGAIKTHISLGHKEVREDNALMTVCFIVLSNVQNRKEATYGRSFCKRGELDVFFNTARKFDRIENIMINGAKDEVGEATIDTVGDLSNYGLLWMTFYLREHNDTFLEWAKNN